jgi:hypothetical protein
MLHLVIPTEPFWVDCPHGVKLLCRPLTTVLNHAAVARAGRRLREMKSADPNDPRVADPDLAEGTLHAESLRALGELLIAAWEGVGDAEGAAAAPVTSDNVRALLSLPEVAAAFNIGISQPLARVVAAQANDGEAQT